MRFFFRKKKKDFEPEFSIAAASWQKRLSNSMKTKGEKIFDCFIYSVVFSLLKGLCHGFLNRQNLFLLRRKPKNNGIEFEN